MEIPTFLWLILIPLISAPLVYLSAHFIPAFKKISPARIVALIALLITWFPFAIAASQINQGESLSFTIGAISLNFDGMSMLLAAVSLGLGTMVVLFSGTYLSAEAGQDKFYAMLTAMVGVMIGLGCSGDLFNLWIWFEAMAITSYLLVAFHREQPASLEAGVKYLAQSAAGSVLVLLGISLVFSQTGTTSLAEIRSVGGNPTAFLAAGALFLIGFGVKTALVPMHTWLPDAHSQAPSGISAMLSGIVIEAGLIAMLRSVAPLAGATNLWGPILIGFGCLNMLVGNLMALRQKHVKRMLAYSSLTHVGYMLVGIGVAIYASQTNSAQGGLFHLFNHGMMKGLAFLAAGALLYTLHISSGEHAPLTIADLYGAARRYPAVAITFSVALLALGGIPPFSGFMSKWQIFVGGFQTQNLLIIILVIFAALNSVFSLVYYTPLVNAVYKRELSLSVQHGGSIPLSMNIPLILLTAGIIIIGLWPSLMNWLTVPAGMSLLASFGG